ncbi:hypothetical protein I552_5571 [Mycobacterium xenopi 3993]|nr:hypothetical protein I552_5571 [Mycobacterium xenopi 3993]
MGSPRIGESPGGGRRPAGRTRSALAENRPPGSASLRLSVDQTSSGTRR